MALTDNLRAALDAIVSAAQQALARLDDVQRVHDREIADRDGELAAAHARIAELEQASQPTPAPAGRFPGDPGPGKAIVGMATTRGDLPQLQAREQATGMGMAHRVFFNDGVSDLAVPSGPAARKILADHLAGRVSAVSFKLGIEALAAGRHRTELVALVRWVEQRDGFTILIVEHEPENNWKADHRNLPRMAVHAADYRKAQQHIRACITEATGGRPQRAIFVGALLTYAHTAEGKAKFGDPDQWNPGTVDGRHVWDVACADHYEPSMAARSLDTAKWRSFVASCKQWGVPPGITELGVRGGNPHAGKALEAMLELAVTRDGCPIVLYFDSKAGKGGALQTDPADWWNLHEANGTLPAWTAFVQRRGVNPNA